MCRVKFIFLEVIRATCKGREGQEQEEAGAGTKKQDQGSRSEVRRRITSVTGVLPEVPYLSMSSHSGHGDMVTGDSCLQLSTRNTSSNKEGAKVGVRSRSLD